MSEERDSAVISWFTGRLPGEWTSQGEPTIQIDRDEVVVTIAVAVPELDEQASDVDRSEAIDGRIAGFRDDTKKRRISIAREAEQQQEQNAAQHAALTKTVAGLDSKFSERVSAGDARTDELAVRSVRCPPRDRLPSAPPAQ